MNLPAFLAIIGFSVIAISAPAQGLIQPTAISANSNTMVSRSPDSRGWTDPALNHNKLLQQQAGDGSYMMIGTYKVKGNPFLFGEHHKGDIFSTMEKGYNIFISYNTYSQDVEFYSSSNTDKPLVKEPGNLDSFIVRQDIESGITASLKFIYGSLLSVDDKSYYQEIYTGKRFSVYKKYKSVLGYASDNFAQTELRQFELQYEYYYTDSVSKGVKKLKKNAGSILKEFKKTADISSLITDESFTTDPEGVLRKVFQYLNEDRKEF